ncbi:pyridoxamine 5'-phosphate oxidase family protein [Clostridium sp.]|jgi:nitroimidazol reductase NimA-like FMN-containing flavoprotein (pyridoxamine 5'-phosphate oxidase superfamily)|uniref:pyridoxamine 5'-phosphate oxidase family protein n=1 Tax=Clostridium sp. TaxID=1506 RepID=UPI00258F70A9|nr:pyridoxamine 5'-phosphate oxidase family protein [Clostridium sp.]
MEKIRYTQRICDDKAKIDHFLIEKRVGTISMCDKEGTPYALPVNYIYWNDKIYIHGMGSGKKNVILEENPSVCFNIFEELGTVTDSVPCKCDTSYFSVVIFGKATLVQDLEEKTQVLTQFLGKFVPNLFKNPLSMKFVDKYRSSLDNNAVVVYCINTEALTAKENKIDMEHMFHA